MSASEMTYPWQRGLDTGAPELASARVLVVDDEPGMRNFLVKTLGGVCRRVDAAEDTASAAALLDHHAYDVIVLDNVMPRVAGLDWLADQQRLGLFADVILITAYANLDTAIAAIRAGASDFLLKPFRSNQIINAIAQSLWRADLRRQNSILRHELHEGADVLRHRTALLGSSPGIQAVREALERAAASPAPTVIRGEVGAGKQVAARALHASSAAQDRPFVWLQCHALGEDAFRERLFGRVGRSMDETREGMLRQAAGGTLFLDDVDKLPMAAQAVLVELLATGRFLPLGAARSVALDMRIVASTTRPLEAAVRAGSVRQDLFYLLNVVEIAIPPLRDRDRDVLDLADFLAGHLAKGMGLAPPVLSAATRRRIRAYPWPGNVLELRNYVERALIHRDFDTALTADPDAPGHGDDSLDSVERRHILRVLDACGGNRAEAARRLGVARKTVERKCRSWGL